MNCWEKFKHQKSHQQIESGYKCSKNIPHST
jgi:hypothetical protein